MSEVTIQVDPKDLEQVLGAAHNWAASTRSFWNLNGIDQNEEEDAKVVMVEAAVHRLQVTMSHAGPPV